MDNLGNASILVPPALFEGFPASDVIGRSYSKSDSKDIWIDGQAPRTLMDDDTAEIQLFCKALLCLIVGSVCVN